MRVTELWGYVDHKIEEIEMCHCTLTNKLKKKITKVRRILNKKPIKYRRRRHKLKPLNFHDRY